MKLNHALQAVSATKIECCNALLTRRIAIFRGPVTQQTANSSVCLAATDCFNP
jgi:hypothetical protein